jgi:hypothetical protein
MLSRSTEEKTQTDCWLLVAGSSDPVNQSINQSINQLTSTSGLGIPASDNATRASNEIPKTFIMIQSMILFNNSSVLIDLIVSSACASCITTYPFLWIQKPGFSISADHEDASSISFCWIGSPFFVEQRHLVIRTNQIYTWHANGIAHTYRVQQPTNNKPLKWKIECSSANERRRSPSRRSQ